MYNYLLPINLDGFCRCCPEHLHVEFIKELLLAFPSIDVHLKKKRFGCKEVYVCDANYGRHYHRLIFEKVNLEGECVYALRDIAWNHDYVKALNWSPWGSMLRKEIPHEYAEFECKVPIITPSGPMVQYKQKWHELSAIQSEVISCQSFPQLIVGPPGSGKTLSIMALFQEQALKHQQNGVGVLKILYLTGSPELRDIFQASWKSWANHELKENRPPVIVQFLTFEALLCWSRENQTLLNNIDLLNRIVKLLPRDGVLTAENVLAEVLTHSCILNLDVKNHHPFERSEYSKLGINQSLIPEAEKEKFFELFKKLDESLSTHHEYISGLSSLGSFDMSLQYHLTAVDEAQNATTQELSNAIEITQHKRVVFVGDSLQKGSIKKSSLPLLGPVLHLLYGIKFISYLLPGSHRLNPEVALLANEVVLLYTNLRQGLADNTSYSSIAPELYQRSERCDHSLSLVREYSDAYHQLGTQSSSAAVVLHERDRRQAEQYIAGKNVFTVHEAQGLEFSALFIYVSEETLAEFVLVDEEMKRLGIHYGTLLVEKTNATPQKGIIDGKHLELISNLYVALSRSYGDVWFYIEPIKNKNLIHKLSSFLPWLFSKFERKEEKKVELIVSSLEEWLSTINQFILQKQLPQAIENLKLHFGFTDAQAKEYVNGLHHQKERVVDLITWGEAFTTTASASAAAAPASKTKPVEAHQHNESTTSHPVFQDPQMKPLSVAALSSEAVQKETDLVTSLLSANLATYVENLLQSQHYNSQPNIDGLFNHKKAAQMLFHHRMNNGHCLFVNFCLDKQIITCVMQHITNSINSNPKIKEKVIAIFSSAQPYAIETQDSLLMLAASIEIGDFSKKNKLKIEGLQDVTQVLESPLLGSPKAGNNVLSYLCTTKTGFKLLLTHQNAIVVQFSKKGLFAQETGSGPNQGSSAFYELCRTPEGLAFLSTHWKKIQQHLSKEGLFAQITGEGVDQGSSPFYWMCRTPEGRVILFTNWRGIQQHISSAGLFAPIRGDGEDQGCSPIYCLCAEPGGCDFLATHWSRIIQDDRSIEYLFSPITGRGIYQGTSPFYLLCKTPKGLAVLSDHWDRIQLHLTNDRLSAQVTGLGEDMGNSPFSWLSSSKDGLDLLRRFSANRSILTSNRLSSESPDSFFAHSLQNNQVQAPNTSTELPKREP